jgi:predicted DsbA family dithiol-disulfide isomerase
VTSRVASDTSNTFIVAFRTTLRKMTNFQVNIVSDTVCRMLLSSTSTSLILTFIIAWCYVGKKRMEKGIAAYKEKHPDSNDTFSTNWFPFYLNPDAPKSADKQQMYESKFGKDRTAMMQVRLSEIGKAEGINFKYGGKTGNTRDSHRLVQLGKTKGPQMQTRVIEELFAAYFENEKDITSRDILTEAGVKAGLDEKEIKGWLESGKGGDEVDREVYQARLQNISGVPNFTLQDRFELGGAQEPEAFVELFERIKRQEGST